MSHNPTSRSSVWFFGFFLIAMLVDIGGRFGLKYLSVLVVLLCVAWQARALRVPRECLYIDVPLFVGLPALFLLLSWFRFPQNVAAAVLAVTPFATWIVLPLLLRMDRKLMLRVFDWVVVLGAVGIVLMFATIYFVFGGDPDDPRVLGLNRFGVLNEMGFFGVRCNADETACVPNVYFRWSMLLVPAAALLVGKSWVKLCLLMVASFCTMSAGIVLFFFLALGLGWVFTSRRRSVGIGTLIVGLVAVALVTPLAVVDGGVLGQEWILDKLTGASPSTLIKLGHIESIVGLLGSQPFLLLFGTGLGSPFFTVGLNEMVSRVEVSHFDLVRQWGLLYATAFFCYVIFLLRGLWATDEEGRRVGLGLLLLFVLAGTNPLLISPVFFLMLIIGRAYMIDFEKTSAVEAGNGIDDRCGALAATKSEAPS